MTQNSTKNNQSAATASASMDIGRQITQLTDKLYNLESCYQFHLACIQVMTEKDLCSIGARWNHGLFLTSGWLLDTHKGIIQELDHIKGGLDALNSQRPINR